MCKLEFCCWGNFTHICIIYISVRRVEGSYYFVSSLLVAFVGPTTTCLDEMAVLFL
jgi:hypothetical protein